MKDFNINKSVFNIEQNKQKINMLLKKKKEQDEKCDKASQIIEEVEASVDLLESDMKQLQNEVDQLQDKVENLPSGGSGESEQGEEEVIRLQSYDVYKTRDMIYRNNMWEPNNVWFCAEIGTKFRFRVKFDAVSTYAKTITSTATISFDDVEVFNETKEIEAGGTHSVDFEYLSSSSTFAGHKLIIKLVNTESSSVAVECCVPEFLTVELWGTNVQFTSRSNDFTLVPADQNIVMTTTVFNKLPMFCIQPAGENLSLDQSAFRTYKNDNYRQFNQIIAHCYHGYDETAARVVFRDKPTLACYTYNTTATAKRVSIYVDIDSEEDVYLKPVVSQTVFTFIRPLINNKFRVHLGKEYPGFLFFSQTGQAYSYNTHNGAAVIVPKDDQTYQYNCDGVGTLRLDNFEPNMDETGVVTKCDGQTYFWHAEPELNNDIPQLLPLGFGTNANVYLMANRDIYVFLRVGQNVKKITINKGDDGLYFIKETSIIEDVQEYWLAPNGSHFERKGNKIFYYLKDATEPSQTLTTHC